MRERFSPDEPVSRFPAPAHGPEGRGLVVGLILTVIIFGAAALLALQHG